jgi:hypothetical protein
MGAPGQEISMTPVSHTLATVCSYALAAVAVILIFKHVG